MPGIDLAFPIMSEESAAPLGIPRRQLVDELRRELDLRRASYPARVQRGKMTPVEAEWQIDVLAAIHADFRADLQFDPQSSTHMALWRDQRAQADAMLNRFRWSDLVEALQREIALRRRYYPQLVAEGRAPAIAARHQLEHIEAVHFAYWLQARRWWPDELDHKRYQSGALTWSERDTYRAAYQRHRDRFEPIEDSPRGKYAASVEHEPEQEGWAA